MNQFYLELFKDNRNKQFQLFWRLFFWGKLLRQEEVSRSPQIELPYPPPNGGQQRLGALVAFVRPSVT